MEEPEHVQSTTTTVPYIFTLLCSHTEYRVIEYTYAWQSKGEGSTQYEGFNVCSEISFLGGVRVSACAVCDMPPFYFVCGSIMHG